MEDEWAAGLARREVFWMNIWQRSGDAGKLPVERVEELDAWSRQMALLYGTDVLLDGYGLIVNPVGSKAQEWHIDYTDDYGTIFIPLTESRPENALQYARSCRANFPSRSIEARPRISMPSTWGCSHARPAGSASGSCSRRRSAF